MTRRRLVLALFVLVLLASAANVGLALTRSDPSPGDARPRLTEGRYRPAHLAGPGGPALEAATRTAGLVLSYDHDRLDESLKAATRTMTAAFAREYRRTFRRTSARAARRQQAVALGVVRGAGLVGVRGSDRATCLVFVDQQLLSSSQTSSSDPPVVLTRSRVLVDVVRRDGRWKVSGVRPI